MTGTGTARVAPTRLGRYEICGEIGQGGMATVYLGRAIGPAGFEKLVALKAMHPHLANESQFVDMFLDEARLTARCSHPNICSLFEIGKDGSRYFLAMEYLVGESLASVIRALHEQPHLRAQPGFYPMCARVMADACRGLHAAHELRGRDGAPLDVIHRDATPHNLFITFTGAVKLMDFGVSKAAGRLHQTESNVAKGKLAFMAPEQLLHRPLDRRVDVWAIGVSMWELLSGRRLFARDNPGATVTAVLNDPIPEPSYEGSEIPEALRSIVIGAIARDPGARFATARDMEVALEGFIAGSGYSVSSATVEALMRALFQARVEEKTREISLLLQPETSTSGVYPRTGSTDLAAPQRARRPLLVGIAATAVLTLAAVVGAYAAGPAGDEDPAPALAGTSGDADDGAGDAAEESGLDERVSEENGARSAATEPPDDAPAVAEPAATRERPAASARAPDARRRRPDRDQPSQATRPVSITTPGGWADISIDGRAHGRTPARIELPIGRHRIVLLPWGRAPAIRRVVHVRRGSSPRIAIDLRE